MSEQNIVRQALVEFLELDWLAYYETDFASFFHVMMESVNVSIENRDIVTVRRWQSINNLSVSMALREILDDLVTFRTSVHDLRWEYYSSSDATELPQDLRSVFGDQCDRLEDLRNRARFVLGFLPDEAPDAKMQKALELWNAGGKTWRQIWKEIDETDGYDGLNKHPSLRRKKLCKS